MTEPHAISPPGIERRIRWLLLGYRVSAAVLLLGVHVAGLAPRVLGSADPRLYLFAAGGWLAFALIGARDALRGDSRLRGLFLPLMADVVCVTLIMHASGGVATGAGMLLLPALGGAALLLTDRQALFIAAGASLAVLGETTLGEVFGRGATDDWAQAGILGIALFSTVILAQVLGRHARESELLATERGLALEGLEQVNAYIAAWLDAGVMLVDAFGRLRHANPAAMRLAGRNFSVGDRIPEPLMQALLRWRSDPVSEDAPFRFATGGTEVVARFRPVGGGGVLALIEDSARLKRHAQQLKLASLGTLTGAIAHEIRNPLAAIHQSAELLGESPQTPEADRKLSRIIASHTRRIDAIVESVLSLSRREAPHPQRLLLDPWLTQFAQEVALGFPGGMVRIATQVTPATLAARFDPVQLHQVLWNLCDNARKHAADATGHVSIALAASRAADGNIQVAVSDSGPGIPDEVAREMFEPFYTTGKGSGIGLYLARELAEVNGASLRYVREAGGGRFILALGAAA